MSMTKQERNERMLEMRKSGMTLDAIAKEFGLTRERVRQIIGTQHKDVKLNSRLAKARTALQECDNITWDELTLISGLHASTLVRHGIKKPPVHKGPPERWPKEKIIDAAIEWKKKNGKFPSQQDWAKASQAHPMGLIIYRKFGSWREFRRAAGETVLDGRKRRPQ